MEEKNIRSRSVITASWILKLLPEPLPRAPPQCMLFHHAAMVLRGQFENTLNFEIYPQSTLSKLHPCQIGRSLRVLVSCSDRWALTETPHQDVLKVTRPITSFNENMTMMPRSLKNKAQTRLCHDSLTHLFEH